MAGQRIAVAGKGRVQRQPVGLAEVLARGRQHGGLFGGHVRQIAVHIAVQRRLEGLAARLAHHLVGQQRMFELADRRLALGMLGVQPVQRGGQLGAAPAQRRKQQLALLGMVQALGKLVHVQQHRAQHVEVGRLLLAPRLLHQQHHRTQHRRKGLVLVLDHEEGRVAHGGPFWDVGAGSAGAPASRFAARRALSEIKSGRGRPRRPGRRGPAG